MICPNCKNEVPDENKFCPNCGTPINSQPQPPFQSQEPAPFQPQQAPFQPQQPAFQQYAQPTTPPAPPKKKGKKKWIIIAVAIVAVIVIGSALGGKDDKPTAPVNNDAVQTVQSDDVAKETPTTALKTTYNAGDEVDLDGCIMKYDSAEVWQGYESYAAPKDGNKVIRLHLSFTNNGKEDAYISEYDFDCYCDNSLYESYFYGEDNLPTVNLSSGRSTEGYIYFEVPENAEKIEVEYEVNFWSDKKIILNVDL